MCQTTWSRRSTALARRVNIHRRHPTSFALCLTTSRPRTNSHCPTAVALCLKIHRHRPRSVALCPMTYRSRTTASAWRVTIRRRRPRDVVLCPTICRRRATAASLRLDIRCRLPAAVPLCSTTFHRPSTVLAFQLYGWGAHRIVVAQILYRLHLTLLRRVLEATRLHLTPCLRPPKRPHPMTTCQY